MSLAQDWTTAFWVVTRFECVHGDGESRGACKLIATNIQEEIGGLVVSGLIKMNQGSSQHWWVEKNDHAIDPLAVLWMDEPFHHEKTKVNIHPKTKSNSRILVEKEHQTQPKRIYPTISQSRSERHPNKILKRTSKNS